MTSIDTGRWVAHRGLPATLPENTLAGIDAVLAAGASWVEIDVQVSADGVAVLHHDTDTERVSGRTDLIGERTLAQLETLDFCEASRLGQRYSPTRIATLSEVAKCVAKAQARVYVEIKSVALQHRAIDDVLSAVGDGLGKYAPRAVLIATDRSLLARARALHVTDEVGWILPTWSAQALEQARQLAPDYLFCNVTKVPATVGHLPALGPRWVMYVVNTRGDGEAWFERGAWQVETDDFPGIINP